MNNIDKVLDYSVDNNFLENLTNKNYEFIRKQIKSLPIVSHIFSKDNKDKAYVIIFYNNDKKAFLIDGFLSKGSYNKTYQIRNKKNYKFVYRLKNDIVTDRNEVMENFLQTFIHGYLTQYQKRYLKDDNLIKINYFGFNQRYKFCSTIVEKMDGTLYFILANKLISFEQKIEILIKSIYQITLLLEKLQEDLRFVHNDLKCDNIFFKFVKSSLEPKKMFESDNLKFYLGDFDTSRIEINGITLMCDNPYIPDRNFSPRKDLFLLVNSLLYSFNDDIWIKSFFKHFPIIKNVIDNEKNYYSLYNFKDVFLDDVYLPKNFKQKLEKLYPNLLTKKID
jgi:hypothetical protein